MKKDQKVEIGQEVRIDYPMKNSILSSVYVKGFVVEDLGDKLRIDITKNSKWTKNHIEKADRKNITEYWGIIWDENNTFRFGDIEPCILTCPKEYVRLPLVLIYEEYNMVNGEWVLRTIESSRKNECGYYHSCGVAGYNFESRGSFGFLQDTFDKLVTGEKKERISTKGRWEKPYYKSVMYFDMSTVDQYLENDRYMKEIFEKFKPVKEVI